MSASLTLSSGATVLLVVVQCRRGAGAGPARYHTHVAPPNPPLTRKRSTARFDCTRHTCTGTNTTIKQTYTYTIK